MFPPEADHAQPSMRIILNFSKDMNPWHDFHKEEINFLAHFILIFASSFTIFSHMVKCVSFTWASFVASLSGQWVSPSSAINCI